MPDAAGRQRQGTEPGAGRRRRRGQGSGGGRRGAARPHRANQALQFLDVARQSGARAVSGAASRRPFYAAAAAGNRCILERQLVPASRPRCVQFTGLRLPLAWRTWSLVGCVLAPTPAAGGSRRRSRALCRRMTSRASAPVRHPVPPSADGMFSTSPAFRRSCCCRFGVRVAALQLPPASGRATRWPAAASSGDAAEPMPGPARTFWYCSPRHGGRRESAPAV